MSGQKTLKNTLVDKRAINSQNDLEGGKELGADSPEAWVALYGDLLFRVAFARVTDHNAAEDLVQEAFLAAWKNRASFDGRSERGTWLVAILRRKIADHFRRVGRRRETTSEGTEVEFALFDERGRWRQRIQDIDLYPNNNVEAEEFWQAMVDCLRLLPSTLATAYDLRELQDIPPAEACEQLAISRQNLAVRLHRARLLLRDCLERRWLGDRP